MDKAGETPQEVESLEGHPLQEESPAPTDQEPDKPTEPAFEYKGSVLSPEDVQSRLKQLEELDKLRGKQGYQLGQKDQEITRLRDELSELKGQVSVLTTQAGSGEEDEDYASRLFDNPNEFLKQYGDKIRDSVLEEVRGEAKQTEAQKAKVAEMQAQNNALVDKFFHDYPDLDDFKDEVALVKTRLVPIAEREGWDIDYSLQRLAEESRKYVIEQKRKYLGNGQPSSPPHVERGVGESASRGAATMTAMDMRKAHKEALDKARNKIKRSHSVKLS